MTFAKYAYPFASIFFSVKFREDTIVQRPHNEFSNHSLLVLVLFMYIRLSIEGEEKTQLIKLQGRSQRKMMTNAMSMVKFFSYLFRVLMMSTL